MQSFRDLKVWHRAHETTLRVYRSTRPFPAEERYGITAQMRRAAGSIGANIAEGCARGSDADFARFLQNALGSASELEYQLVLARDIEYLAAAEAAELTAATVEIERMLTGLISRLRADG
jgi:four helix bundle protein